VTDDATADGEPPTAAELLAAEIKRFRITAGLSQRDLARRSGYTREYVSMAERPGNIPSRDLVRALDSALDADGTLLDLRTRAKAEQRALRDGLRADSSPDHVANMSRHAVSVGTAPPAATAGALVPAPIDMPRLESLRRSLLGRTLDREPAGEVSAIPLQKGVAEAHRLYQQANYDDAAQLLPSLIGRLDESTQSTPAHLKAATYLAAAKLATKMGDAGLAWVAADRCLAFAKETGRLELIGIANYQVACALLRNGHLADAEETAAQAMEPLALRVNSPRSNDDEIISVRGALLLLLAILSARQGDAHAARRNLADAARLADRLGQDGNALWTAFGPTYLFRSR